MAKNKDEHYRYTYLSDLCTEYRKAAISSGTRKGTVAAMWAPVKGVSFVIESTENMLDSFDTFGRQIKNTSASRTGNKNSRVGTEADSTKTESTSGCGDTQEKQTFKSFLNDLADPNQDASLEIEAKGTGRIKSASNQLYIDKLPGIEGIDEDILKYMEECWDCDLKVQFDWQLKPLNLLIGLEGFLDDIEDLLNMLNDMLDPSKFLANFCDFFDGFNWICPPDLVALLLALSMLIKKYMMLSIDINLDWTALLGPIIKWIVDAIASFLQQIVQIIVAPLDCVIGVLQSIQSVIDAADDLSDSAISAANYLSSGVSSMFDGETNPTPAIVASKGNPTWDSFYKEEDTNGSIASQFKKVNQEVKSGSTEGFLQTPADERVDARVQTQRTGPQIKGFKLAREIVNDAGRMKEEEDRKRFAIPTGISIGVDDTFDKFFADRKKKKANGEAVFDLSKISVFKTSIMAVQSARQYIVDFFNQILYALSSLNAIFNAKLSLNVESLGLILLLIDLIKLIKMIINLKHANCDTLKNNPELVLQTLRQEYPLMDFELSDNNTIELTDGVLYNTKIPLDSCSTSSRSSEEASRALNLKRTVEKISGLKLR